VGPRGGLADIYLDDFKQLAPLDCYSPIEARQQILYYRNGLDTGPHTLKIVVRGTGNPISKGTEIYVESVQFSDATGSSGFGEGGGPTGTQRMILGYTGRTNYVDSAGNSWRPATEVITRTGELTDAVAKTWWTMRQVVFIEPRDAMDQELYQHGIHYRDFRVPLTVGPGTYYVRLKFAETQLNGPRQRAMTIWINGKEMVEGFDIFATAGAANTPVDLVYNNVQPKNGVIEIRLAGEVGTGDGGAGVSPKTIYK
jgi:hypothetical protein